MADKGIGTMSIRNGDIVKVTIGKDRGKEGKVIRVYPGNGTVLVESINLVKRHVKPNSRNQKGGIIEKEAPLNISNVTKIETTE
jgi:large subunit ribosomal protein L24